MTAMLIRSDNSAAETLAGDYPGGRDEFIREMNDRARSLGMLSTRFEDASGLSANNVSSAHDIAILVTEALKQDYMRKTTVIKHTEIEVPGKKRPIKIQINNTNTPLLGAHDSAVLSKTGLTSRAGFCVAMAFEQEGQQYIVVVLGAKNKAERTEMVERSFGNFIR
jgi:D-alanyl-D-alanine endopeptidase (penicillin-binding protein 7)